MNGRFWPCLVIGFLALNVAIVAVTVSAAHRDGGPALVSNLQERSMRWDQWRAAAARSDALGWTVKVNVAPAESSPGTVTILINDAKGPVVGTTLQVSVRHDAHPNQVVTLACSTDEYGIAIGHHTLTQPGSYTVHVQSASTRDRAAYGREFVVLSTVPRSVESRRK